MENFSNFFDKNEYEEEEQISGKNAIVYLVDATESSTKLLIRIMRKLIEHLYDLIQTNDKAAIVLFGSKKESSKTGFPNIYTLLELADIDILTVMKLEKFIETDEFQNVLYSDEFSLRNAIHEASWLISKEKKCKRLITLITSNDDPLNKQEKEKQLTIMKANDLVQSSITLSILGLDTSHNLFNFEKFYAHLSYYSQKDDRDQKFESIESSSFEKQMDQKLKMLSLKFNLAFHVPFQLSSKITIGIKAATQISPKGLPPYVTLDPVTNIEVESSNTPMCETTGKELKSDEIELFYQFGGEKIFFNQQEINEMKSYGKPRMQLLGFRAQSMLKDKLNVTRSHFMVADESLVFGSCSLFSHLVDRLSKRELMGICGLIAQKRSSPKMVAIIPQLAGYDHVNECEILEGFHVIELPFADDFRTPKETIADIPSQPLRKSAKEVIKKLTLPYKSVENPILQNMNNYLKAAAIESIEIPEIVDLTEPNNSEIFQKAGSVIDEFNKLTISQLPSEDIEKRKAGSMGKTATKKFKTEDLSVINCKNMVKDGTIGSLTVVQLKNILTDAEVPFKKSAKKSELVQAVVDHFL